MIDATELTKTFGDKVAVDNLSFSVRSGMVTGFLGPNGAGKSTTMRLILGLDHPTKGHCRVNGRSYRYTKAPMTEVGALLEAKSVHPGRTARSHLKALAATHGIPKKRVNEVIELVGLSAVANKRAGGFSLGMSQRLGLAAALLGDPETLVLDEPINGLDPEGVAWVRSLLKYLAEEGRTVFISSHLMSEMAMTADHVIIIGRGRLIADSPMSELIERASGRVIKVRSPEQDQIREVVSKSGRSVTDTEDGALMISGLSAEAIGKEAARRGWTLYELTPMQRSLEDIYMELTDSSQEFRSDGRFEELAPSQAIRLARDSDVAPDIDMEPEEPEGAEEVEEPAEVEAHEVPEVREIEPDLPRRSPKPRAYDSQTPSRPRFSDEIPPIRSRTSELEPPPRSRVVEPEPAPRSRVVEPDSVPRSRVSDYGTPRPRTFEPAPRPRFSDAPRPRVSDPEPPPRPRFSGSEPVPRSRISDSEPVPRSRISASEPLSRPRISDPEPLSRPRISDPEPLPRRRTSVPRPDLPPRPRSLDSDPAPRPRTTSRSLSTDPPLPRRSGLPRRSDPPLRPSLAEQEPLIRPRFMDADYRPRPRSNQPDPAEPTSYKPAERRRETSDDPLRLPRPRPGTTGLDPDTSDPNRPRRAWGV